MAVCDLLARSLEPVALSIKRVLMNQQAPGPVPGLHLLVWGWGEFRNLDLKELR